MKMKPREDEGPNMTPMIDVVFQLIIFFMLVTEMAQADLEVLELPRASEAVAQEGADSPFVVNITEDGRIKVRGRDRSRTEELRNLLELEAAKEWVQPFDKAPYSDRGLLIRADKDAEYRIVRNLMQICILPRVKIYKISFGAEEEK